MKSNMNTEYAVSVYMTTFFHEKYIEQALESVLAQEVDFKFEIVISDDASTDETPAILKHYAEKFGFIRVNINERNLGLTANMFRAKRMCTGKYIIPLSGDDYWIDKNKLQRQYDFLESHPEFIAVATRVAARTGDSLETDFVEPPRRACNKVFRAQDYLNGKNYPLNGMMMRNVIEDNLDIFSLMPRVSKYIDDITDSFLILLIGDVYISDNITVAYRRRISAKGEHNFNSLNKGVTLFEKKISLMNGLEEAFSGKYDFFKRYRGIVSKAMVKLYRPFHDNGFRAVYKTIPLKYRRRNLGIQSFLHIPKMVMEVVQLHLSK